MLTDGAQGGFVNAERDAEALSHNLHIMGAVLLVAAGLVTLNSEYWFFWLGLPLGIMLLFFMGLWPGISLILLIICFPMETIQEQAARFNIPSATKVLGAGLLLVCLARCLVLRQASGVLRFGVSKLVALWMAFVCLSLISSIDAGQSLAQIRQTLPGLVIFFVVACIVRDRKSYKQGVLGVVLASSIACGASLAFYYLVSSDERFTGFMDDPNFFASFFVPSYSLVLFFLLRARGLPVVIWGGALMLHLAALMQTQSRGALLSVALQTLFFLPELRRRFKVRYLGHMLLGLLLVCAVAVLFAPKGMGERVLALFHAPTAATEPSLSRRASYVVVAVEHIAEKPLMGSGLGTYPGIFAKSRFAVGLSSVPGDIFRYAHNTYLEMISDIGIPGGLAFIGIMIVSLGSFHRQRGRLLEAGETGDASLFKAMFSAMLGLLLMLATISSSFNKELWLFIALAATAHRYGTRPPGEECAKERLP